MTLEEEFHQDMLSGVETLKKECGYNPTYFIRMVHAQGGLMAAKSLLANPQAQAGLHELCLLNRLQLSMEAVVMEKRYRSLFTEEEITIAKQRLERLGYDIRTHKRKNAK